MIIHNHFVSLVSEYCLPFISFTMNLHEYQAKHLLKAYQVNVPMEIAVSSVQSAEEAYLKIKNETNSPIVAVKAQIHAGGRGKGKTKETNQNGVVIVSSLEELKTATQNLLGRTLVTAQTGPEGKKVNTVLISQNIYYDGPAETKELYLSILLDRAKGQNVIIYSPEGGMDIEAVAEKSPEKIQKEWVDAAVGLQTFQARRMAFNLELSGMALKNFVKLVMNLYQAYVGTDAALMEINPLFKAKDDAIIAADAKINIDDNALKRHPNITAMRDLTEEDPVEVEAGQYNLNFVKLDGNVGCMVNGAGLAMATMDMIKLSGGEPANFLDVGGSANAETVEAGFKIILKDPNVKAILINIFGGIVRCDRVSAGIIEAFKKMGSEIHIPIIVRLQGTNAEEAKKMIDASGLQVESAILLSEAAQLVKEAIQRAEVA